MELWVMESSLAVFLNSFGFTRNDVKNLFLTHFRLFLHDYNVLCRTVLAVIWIPN